ncbi:hypothetical protein T069G_06429 [Trichoderma breve]|uniref:Uncharacterized protein n=1 Tax=Trichoderma breve TaxID=2034170 RepID=A0A9W9B7R4_9HYPO|nr:hypothetical protein T069G_06429 [Trichoderma breve]KAJ4858162.1 hypothetical protein T069G_06429 [Trichoderma breve]
MHLNAKTILQIHGRLNRLGQKNAVKWHNLKVKNYFHDHEERVLLTKWSRQSSAEASFPYWISGALREVVHFELMKAYMNHPFNRYAYVVIYDRDAPKMEYYTQKVVKLGHACSALVKLMTETDRGQSWTENDEYLMVAMLEMSQEISVGEFETRLTCGEQLLRQKNGGKARKDEVEGRKKQSKSDELLSSEDMEGESEREDEAEELADEEFPLVRDE